MAELVTLTPENTVAPLRGSGNHLVKSFDLTGQFFELPKVIQNDAGMYEVVVGRWRVQQTLFRGGYANLEAELVDWDREQQAVANLSSNMTASTNWQVDPWDIQALLESGKEQKEVAQLVGCSPAKISQLLKVFDLIPGLQDRIKAGDLEGRDNILKCARLPIKDQKLLAQEDGKIVSSRINELLNRKKVRPIENIEDAPDFQQVISWNGNQGDARITNDGLSVSGLNLDDLLAGEIITRQFELDGSIFEVEITLKGVLNE